MTEDQASGGDPGAGPDPGPGGRPAWIPVVDVGESDGELADAYGEAGVRGPVANIIGVHSLHPDAMVDHLRLYRTLMFGTSPLSRGEREAVAVVVSAVNDCFY